MMGMICIMQIITLVSGERDDPTAISYGVRLSLVNPECTHQATEDACRGILSDARPEDFSGDGE
jgi:hypothetical protein